MPRDSEKKVAVFGAVMDSRLKTNEKKGHWNNLSPEQVISNLKTQVHEAEQAYLDFKEEKIGPGPVLKKCADVANYALFLADNVGAIPPTVEQAEQEIE